MVISKNCVVGIHYTLTNAQGDLLDSSEGTEPLEYIHGTESLIPGLEKELEGKEEKATFKVVVPATEAYGERRDDLVMNVSRDKFDSEAEIEAGMQFEASTPDGYQVVTVVKVEKDEITIDANHPLAGEELHFDVTVESVREATADELENGLASSCGCGCCCGDDCDCDDGCDCSGDSSCSCGN